MKKLLFIIAFLGLFAMGTPAQQVWPLQTTPHPTVSIPVIGDITDGDVVGIPVNVTGFQNIGSVTLHIIFDPLSFQYTGTFVNSNSHEQLTFEMNPACNPTGINIGTVGDKIVIGMYSVPPVTIPDGVWLTLYMRYTNSFVNYSEFNFNYPVGTTEVVPWVMLTDQYNYTIKPAEILTDSQGKILYDTVRTPYYDKKTDDTLIWINIIPKRGEIDYPRYFSDGRVGPLVDKPPYAAGTATISGKLTYGNGTLPVAQVKVTAMNWESSATYETTTGTDGKYSIIVPKGLYQLKAGDRCTTLTWVKPDEADYSLAWGYATRTVPITDELRANIFLSMGGDLPLESMGAFRRLIDDKGSCGTPGAFKRIWNSTTNPATWPKPTDSFDWDAGDINAQGVYKTKAPKPGDGFNGQTVFLNVNGNVTQNLKIACLYDVNGDAYNVVPTKKVQCTYMIPKTTGKKGAKITTYTQCKNNALPGKTRCNTHLLSK